MKNTKEFPFEKARRVTPRELAAVQRAIEERTGVPRQVRGRPPKADAEKYQPNTIRLHPKGLAWARREARKRGGGYRPVINETLLQKHCRLICVKTSCSNMALAPTSDSLP